eukprot:CAMPEP_0197893872 /NCGR_PEP_ID=MMETSP1439-20131203/33688_1 /TAXON_ID=66791 /ORGANISM="Gonyaulax spinifera, Strain CCMP409" /LENGTH=73 /DNA_ID=CAMNT_0043514171 /DNA_START=11 /DNA_END=229 /DNA_ORIENTATION=+
MTITKYAETRPQAVASRFSSQHLSARCHLSIKLRCSARGPRSELSFSSKLTSTPMSSGNSLLLLLWKESGSAE